MLVELAKNKTVRSSDSTTRKSRGDGVWITPTRSRADAERSWRSNAPTPGSTHTAIPYVLSARPRRARRHRLRRLWRARRPIIIDKAGVIRLKHIGPVDARSIRARSAAGRGVEQMSMNLH